MISVSTACALPTFDQCSEWNSRRYATHRGERFMSTSSFILRRGLSPAVRPARLHEIPPIKGGISWYAWSMIERAQLLARIKRALKRSRVVALIGPRQSGKTTLARQIVAGTSVNYFYL